MATDAKAAKESGANEQGTSLAAAKPRRPLTGLISSCLFLLGLGSLAYIVGAAAVFFDLPTSTFLRRAFVGAAAWYEQKRTARPQARKRPGLLVGKIDKPDKTCDGFTLCMYQRDSRAALVNMRGDVVHEWHMAFSSIWPDPPHVRGWIDDAEVVFNDGHVYPNGELVVVMEGPAGAKNPSTGYGLARLDRDSRVLWKYAANCHHDLDVGEDGRIYAISNSMVDQLPKGLDYIPRPCLVDFVDVLSPDGQLEKRISLLKAFQDSPYAPLLCPLERPPRRDGPGAARAAVPVPPLVDEVRRRDVLHANAVKVLNPSLAPRFPLFKAGQLLISARHLDAIAVLDPDSEKIVWAARGPWHAQHDPTFLDNGHFLLFDNQGSPRGSRVLEYDPCTQAFPWSYQEDQKGVRFFSSLRGMSQRLANGNTLIVNSDSGEMFEVTVDREIVWSYSSPGTEFYRARRYRSGQLPFLNPDRRPRP
jgi:Arylsulfotransferase (ASST)